MHSVNWIIRSKTLTITQEKILKKNNKTVKYENVIKRSEIHLLNCAFKRSEGVEINSISWETTSIPYIYNANTEVRSSTSIVSTWFLQFV